MLNKMDFTLIAYKQLISTLQSQGYFFQTFEEYIQNPKKRVVILRHDVDRKPGNALVFAEIEKDAGGRRSEVRGQRSEVGKGQKSEQHKGQVFILHAFAFWIHRLGI